jgi:biopolymer transport protein ExbB
MKKLFAFVAIFSMINLGAVSFATAQSGTQTEQGAQAEDGDEMDGEANANDSAATEMNNTPDPEIGGEETVESAETSEVETETKVTGFSQTVKRYFIEGDPTFMSFVLICLILGLALCIERIIYLNMATTNTRKLLGKIEEALDRGGLDAAKEVCRNTPGPVASIFYQGLEHSDEDLNQVEKSIEAYGGVQMGLLEKGLSWISLFIAIAPMLGFMGTVFGMIVAFDQIAEANTVNAALVAGGIKLALITTVSGLIVAIILQIFYNYILAKIDSIVLDMEDASIELIDMLYRRNVQNKNA